MKFMFYGNPDRPDLFKKIILKNVSFRLRFAGPTSLVGSRDRSSIREHYIYLWCCLSIVAMTGIHRFAFSRYRLRLLNAIADGCAAKRSAAQVYAMRWLRRGCHHRLIKSLNVVKRMTSLGRSRSVSSNFCNGLVLKARLNSGTE